MFLMYTAELEDVAAGMGVSILIYADDTQLYVHYKPSGMIYVVTRLEQCIDRVDKWMAASRLKLNLKKSEVIWVGSARTLQKHPSPESLLAPVLFKHLRKSSSSELESVLT
jgi:Reverse transcriptase (RNA-dependent DNA polymerase)